jgi:SAM-dependent methyltransferase
MHVGVGRSISFRATRMSDIHPSEGRKVFGNDPAGYDRARPQYPARIYQILTEKCGLKAGTATFEIGPGPGLATKELLRLGARPLVAIEPDARLAEYLVASLGSSHPGLTVRNHAFEDVELEEGAFDLGIAATSFHWLDQAASLKKVARVLKPGGWWAMWWNVFGDPTNLDPFQKATNHLFVGLERSPDTWTKIRPAFSLDVETRTGTLKATEAFDLISHEIVSWSHSFDTAGIVALYRTFSPVARLPDREKQAFSEGIAKVADEQFGGRVERPFLTPIYIARRRRD